MKTYTLERSQVLAASMNDVWDFFSSPENLDKLTPTDMGFDILSNRPLPSMFEGQEIEYKVRPVLNIPLYWKTRITKVEPLSYFIDEQLKGPYTLWRHTHTFTEKEGKISMHDKVEYALPLGFLGSIAHSIFVRARLEEIFDYRYKVVEEVFN